MVLINQYFAQLINSIGYSISASLTFKYIEGNCMTIYILCFKHFLLGTTTWPPLDDILIWSNLRIPSHLGTLNHGPWSCSGLWFNFKQVLKSPATKVCSSEVVDCEFRQVVISINPEVVSEFTQPQDSRKKRMAKHLCMTRVTFIVCYILPSFTKDLFKGKWKFGKKLFHIY